MERHVHDIRLTVKQSLKKENGAIKYRYIEEEQTIHWHKKKDKRTNNDLQNIHIQLQIE
jgi:hypothetical protein